MWKTLLSLPWQGRVKYILFSPTTLWFSTFYQQIRSGTFYKLTWPPEKLRQVPLNVISIAIVSFTLQIIKQKQNKKTSWGPWTQIIPNYTNSVGGDWKQETENVLNIHLCAHPQSSKSSESKSSFLTFQSKCWLPNVELSSWHIGFLVAGFGNMERMISFNWQLTYGVAKQKTQIP